MSVRSFCSFNYGPDASMKVTGIWTGPTGSDALGTPSIQVVITPHDIAREGSASLIEQGPGIRQEIFARALETYDTLLGNPQTWRFSVANLIDTYFKVWPNLGEYRTEGMSYIFPAGPSDPSAFGLLISDWSNPGIYLHPDQASEIHTNDGGTVKASDVVQKVRQLCSLDEAKMRDTGFHRPTQLKRFDVERAYYKQRPQQDNDTKWQDLVRTATRVALDYYGLREVYGPSVTLVPAKDSTMYPSMSPRDETLYDFPEA